MRPFFLAEFSMLRKKTFPGNIIHQKQEQKNRPLLGAPDSTLTLIPPGCDPFWHPVPTHKVQKYNNLSAGAAGSREREARTVNGQGIVERVETVGCKKNVATRELNPASKSWCWAPQTAELYHPPPSHLHIIFRLFISRST